jgi:hypothetical protein
MKPRGGRRPLAASQPLWTRADSDSTEYFREPDLAQEIHAIPRMSSKTMENIAELIVIVPYPTITVVGRRRQGVELIREKIDNSQTGAKLGLLIE